MAVGPPSAQWLKLSDEKMAYTLLAWILEQVAERRGVSVQTLDHAQAKTLLASIPKQDIPDVRVAAMEKALRKIVGDELAGVPPDPEGGGRIFREFLLDGAERTRLERKVEKGRRTLKANLELALAKVIKYSAAQRAEWRRLDRLPEIAKLKSASDRARQIAKRISPGPQPAALVQAIRKDISKAAPAPATPPRKRTSKRK